VQQALGDFGFLLTRVSPTGQLLWGVYLSSPREQYACCSCLLMAGVTLTAAFAFYTRLCYYFRTTQGVSGSACAKHVNDGQFHDILVAPDGDTVRIYVDDVLVLNSPLPGVTLAGSLDDVLTIGCQPDRLFFAGRIAGLDLHFRALSSFEGLHDL